LIVVKSEAARLIDATVAAYGGIDVLVNNVGGGGGGAPCRQQ
jgi:NAD(P)-dependent dehydrogenase (short-subunit alcohol dehydrogenase family)